MNVGIPDNDFPPQRHGCLTAWLGITLSFSAMVIFITPFMYAPTKHVFPDYSPFLAGVIIVCALARIVFTTALLKWYRWGFYGIVGVDIVAVLNNLTLGIGFVHSLFGLIGIGVLYWLLNMGEEKAWDYLR